MATVFTSNPVHGNPEPVVLENLCNQLPIILDGKHVGVIPDIDLRASSPAGDFRAEEESITFDDPPHIIISIDSFHL